MTFLRRSLSRAAALAVGLVLVAAGCSSGSAAKKATGTGPAGEDGSAACRLLTRAEVKTALGTDPEGEGESNQVGPAANCDWRVSGQFVRLALVQANSPGDAAQTFDVLDDRPGAQLIPGLGDKAVILANTPDAKNAQLFILTGDRMVTVSYCCANEQQLVDLGRRALGRLD